MDIYSTYSIDIDTRFTSGQGKARVSALQSHCFGLCLALGCRIPLLFVREAAVPLGLPPRHHILSVCQLANGVCMHLWNR